MAGIRRPQISRSQLVSSRDAPSSGLSDRKLACVSILVAVLVDLDFKGVWRFSEYKLLRDVVLRIYMLADGLAC